MKIVFRTPTLYNVTYRRTALIPTSPSSCSWSLSQRMEEDSIAVSLTEGFACPEKTVYSPQA